MQEVFQLKKSSEWRGLGEIAESGVELTEQYAQFDAEKYFNTQVHAVADDPLARCGDVLTGKCKPSDCPLFGQKCNPDSAYGALMVSSEGACSAYYQYRREM